MAILCSDFLVNLFDARVLEASDSTADEAPVTTE
jgi:hypothetical protein